MAGFFLDVRDRSRQIQGSCSFELLEHTVAALSADPDTIDELAAALGRFRDEPVQDLSQLLIVADGVQELEERLVIDLAARMVVGRSTPDRRGPALVGYISQEEGLHDMPVAYDLSEEWLFLPWDAEWQQQAEERRAIRARQTDTREVLYGRPLLEHLARSGLDAWGCRGRLPDQEPGGPENGTDGAGQAAAAVLRQIREIHAQWLLTPRADLQGNSPRGLLLQDLHHLERDMQDRECQWSELGNCPPGISRAAHAYRFGGYGFHEAVLYYDLIRHLLEAMNQQLQAADTLAPAATAFHGDRQEDTLDEMVAWLAGRREAWLDTPHPDHHDWTPRYLIESERTRIPLAMSGADCVVDHDCPICAMMAEDPGPYFWHLDGYHMDDEYAFSFYSSLTAWEARYQPPAPVAGLRGGSACDATSNAALAQATFSEGVWKASFTAPGMDDLPLAVRVLSLGFHLAELISDLKGLGCERAFLERLSREYSNLRVVVESEDRDQALSLLEPTIARFRETLEDLSDRYPVLWPKCRDLQNRLQKNLTLDGERVD